MALSKGTDRVELTAQRLLEAYKVHGEQHAQRVFSALLSEYQLKAWEARAIRERFQALQRGAPLRTTRNKPDSGNDH